MKLMCLSSHYYTFVSLISSNIHTSTLLPYTTLFRSATAPGRRRPGRHSEGIEEVTQIRGLGYLKVQTRHIERWREFALEGLGFRSEEHTSELQSRENIVCRLLLVKKK